MWQVKLWWPSLNHYVYDGSFGKGTFDSETSATCKIWPLLAVFDALWFNTAMNAMQKILVRLIAKLMDSTFICAA